MATWDDVYEAFADERWEVRKLSGPEFAEARRVEVDLVNVADCVHSASEALGIRGFTVRDFPGTVELWDSMRATSEHGVSHRLALVVGPDGTPMRCVGYSSISKRRPTMSRTEIIRTIRTHGPAGIKERAAVAARRAAIDEQAAMEEEGHVDDMDELRRLLTEIGMPTLGMSRLPGLGLVSLPIRSVIEVIAAAVEHGRA